MTGMVLVMSAILIRVEMYNMELLKKEFIMKTIKKISIVVIAMGMILMANSALFAKGIPLSQLIFYADFESDRPHRAPDTSLNDSYPPDDYITLVNATVEGNSALVQKIKGNNVLEIIQTHPGAPRDTERNIPPISDKAYFYGELTGVTRYTPLSSGQYSLSWTSSLQPGSPAGTTGAGFGNSHGGFAFAVIYGENGTIIIKHNGGEYDTGIPYKLGVPQAFWAELNADVRANFTLYIDYAPVVDGSGNPKVFTFVDPRFALLKFAVTIGHNARYTIDNLFLIRHPVVEPEWVEIDIEPNSEANCKSINLKSNGIVPMAIYGSDTVDVSTILPETILLTGAAVKQDRRGKYLCREKDIDVDGFVDLICGVNTNQLVILNTGELYAVLEAETEDGTHIQGEERICVIWEEPVKWKKPDVDPDVETATPDVETTTPVVETTVPDAVNSDDNNIIAMYPVVKPEWAEIDIEPNSETSCKSINLKSNDAVPMAIYGSDTLNVSTILPETILLTGAAVKQDRRGKYLCREEDINEDGFVDLICKVNTDQLVILNTGKLHAVLEAKTGDGTPVQGEKRICVKEENSDKDK